MPMEPDVQLVEHRPDPGRSLRTGASPRGGVFSATASMLTGAVCLVTTRWPIALPVLGLALAANAIVKGTRAGKAWPRNLGIISAVLNGIVVARLLAMTYLQPVHPPVPARKKEALDSGDAGAAKALLLKLVVSPADAPPQESQPEPEISPEDAAKEMALALSAVADLARVGKLFPEVVELLRTACRVFLADGLRPRSPIDVEVERVEVATQHETLEQQPTAGSVPTCWVQALKDKGGVGQSLTDRVGLGRLP